MITDIFFFSSLTILIATMAAAVDMLFGVTSMKTLSRTGCGEKRENKTLPLVSIIVPACNEETNIREAMHSLLKQDYANLEVIAVNDRSTDKTGAILEEIARTNDKLKVHHINMLPEGWMGKANALQQGAGKAHGAILLFTDADIVMAQDTVSKAVQYMQDSNRDHLCLIFRNTSPGWLLNSLILDAGAGLMQLVRPWRAGKQGSKTFIGVGAFNMVRRDVYKAIGEHSGIRMHPIDDIMLGKLIKKGGFSQECLLGQDMVRVPWYGSVGHMVEGLMKNVLALVNYRFALVPPLLGAIVFFNILPLWGLLLGSGTTRLLFGATLLIRLCEFGVGAHMLRLPMTCAFGTLLSPYISCYIIAKATWKNMRDDGIYWRGTRYPLTELRKNEPVFF